MQASTCDLLNAKACTVTATIMQQSEHAEHMHVMFIEHEHASKYIHDLLNAQQQPFSKVKVQNHARKHIVQEHAASASLGLQLSKMFCFPSSALRFSDSCWSRHNCMIAAVNDACLCSIVAKDRDDACEQVLKAST